MTDEERKLLLVVAVVLVQMYRHRGMAIGIDGQCISSLVKALKPFEELTGPVKL